MEVAILADGAVQPRQTVSADGKNPLMFHFEKYDSANQMAFLWVRVPQVTAATNTDKVHIYYGNGDAEAAGDAGWFLPAPPRGVVARLGIIVAGSAIALLLAIGIVTAGMVLPSLFDRIAPEAVR